MELELIDLVVRAAATGIALILCVLFWFSRIALGSRIAFFLMVLTTFSRFWSTLPSMTALDDPVQTVLKFIGTGAAFCVTWFLVSIFLDDKRHAWLWLLSGAVVSAGLVAVPFVREISPYLRAYAILHFVAVMGLFVLTARDDLQDARRRMRPITVAILLTHATTMAAISTPMAAVQPVPMAFAQAVSLFAFTVIFAIWSLKANINHWPGEIEPSTAPSPVQRSMEQNLLINRIQSEMQLGVWQVEGLTVAALAQRVKAPEHQVRRAINQVLGHRNFASFINSARIDAAKAKLSAPEAPEVTILEIAYDVGFSSLGPFNRAFREVTGLSPTDFRKQARESLGTQA